MRAALAWTLLQRRDLLFVRNSDIRVASRESAFDDPQCEEECLKAETVKTKTNMITLYCYD